MKTMSKYLILIFLFILIILTACVAENDDEQKEYVKCTSVCASVLGDDFVTMELCRQECEKKSLEK